VTLCAAKPATSRKSFCVQSNKSPLVLANAQASTSPKRDCPRRFPITIGALLLHKLMQLLATVFARSFTA